MQHTCKMCIALGSDGSISKDGTIEELTAHSNLHWRQLQAYAGSGAVDSNVFDQCFSAAKTEGETDLYQSRNSVDQGSTAAETTPDYRFQNDQQPGVSPIRGYCQKLLAKHRGLGSKIECAECGQLIRSRSKNIASHTIPHLSKLLFACRHCEHETMGESAMQLHVAQVHKLRGKDQYLDSTADHLEEVFAMLRHCFGPQKPEAPESQTKRICSISRYFGRLHRAHWWKQYRIRCQQCDTYVKVGKPRRDGLASFSMSLNSRRAIAHASIHLGKFLFHCRHCSHRTVSEVAMKRHLAKRHRLGSNKENYVNLTGEHRDEIIDIIEHCFGRSRPTDASKPEAPPTRDDEREKQKDIFGENIIKARAGENELFAERQLHSRRLLTKFAKSGMIKCRICSHMVNIKQPCGFSNEKAIWHASTHVDKPLFRCKRCQEPIHVMSSVYRHMKKAHGITKGVAAEYEDYSNELHQEILTALTKSFDWGEDNSG